MELLNLLSNSAFVLFFSHEKEIDIVDLSREQQTLNVSY